MSVDQVLSKPNSIAFTSLDFKHAQGVEGGETQDLFYCFLLFWTTIR